eukprot:1158106-Pelagomonas_calceolata.AAC.6
MLRLPPSGWQVEECRADVACWLTAPEVRASHPGDITPCPATLDRFSGALTKSWFINSVASNLADPIRGRGSARLNEAIWGTGFTLGGNKGRQKLWENRLEVPNK